MTQEEFDAIKEEFISKREIFQEHKQKTLALRHAVLHSVEECKPKQKASKVAYLQFLSAQAIAVECNLKKTSYPRGD